MVDLREDGVYETVCAAKGHRQFTILQSPKWALLFDAGALALHDNYLREAIATFSAALENFWAFYVRVIGRVHGLPDELRKELRGQTKLSERRFGAMCFAYALEERAAYPFDPTWVRDLRNPVIHDGRFASRDEAMKYGQHVYRAMLTMACRLRDAHAEEYGEETMAGLADAHRSARAKVGKIAGEARFPTLAVMTLLDSQMMHNPPMSFADALEDWRTFNWWNMAKTGTPHAAADDSPTRVE